MMVLSPLSLITTVTYKALCMKVQTSETCVCHSTSWATHKEKNPQRTTILWPLIKNCKNDGVHSIMALKLILLVRAKVLIDRDQTNTIQHLAQLLGTVITGRKGCSLGSSNRSIFFIFLVQFRVLISQSDINRTKFNIMLLVETIQNSLKEIITPPSCGSHNNNNK